MKLETTASGDRLAAWLNDSRGTAAHYEVCDVLDKFAAVRARISGYSIQTSIALEGRSYAGRVPKEFVAEDPEYEKRMSALRRKMRKYSSYNLPLLPLEGRWVFSRQPSDARLRRKEGRLGQHDAAELVFAVAAEGQLERILRCDCGTWFFGRSLRRRFCSDACRQRRYKTSSEEFKAKRREYMRRYYASIKERDNKRREQLLLSTSSSPVRLVNGGKKRRKK